jgi:putative ABC transport system permease protein
VPRFMSAGQTAADAAANPSLNLESIHPNYFETFRIRILRGRSFTDADREGALNVAIISEDVAARTWPGDDPIGKRLKMGGPDSEDPWWTVVGVAEPTGYRELKKARSTLYLPARNS